MGWLRWFLRSDIRQQLDIHGSKDHTGSLRQHLRRKGVLLGTLEPELERVCAELDDCKLHVAGLTRVLVSRGVLGAEELESLVQAVEPE